MLTIFIRDQSVTHEYLGDMRNRINGAKEKLEDQLESVRQIISAADASLLKILGEDQAHLQSSIDSIVQAQRIVETRPDIRIEDNCAGHGIRVIFGTDVIVCIR